MRRVVLLFAVLHVASAARAQEAGQTGLTPFQRAKAQGLLDEKLACLGCHELSGRGGRVAPSLTDAGRRRGAAYIRAIIDDPQRIVPNAAMPRIPMPPPTRDLIVAYLAGNGAADAAPPVSATSAPRARAEAVAPAPLYAKWCSACHGATGDGDGPNARYLPIPPAVHSSAARMSVRPDDALFDAIAGGGAVMGKSPRMPPFGGTLTPEEIRSLVAYIRTLCSCRGPSWSTDDRR